VLVTLHYFGVNLTAALAGLGVGGIAVALAAQKTLENVIGGVSLIFDQAVRVGDTLKVAKAARLSKQRRPGHDGVRAVSFSLGL
jgi:MscS family membrane protein